VLSRVEDSSRICLSGDSAGGPLILSLLLHYGLTDRWRDDRPGLAVLLSPWVTIVSPQN
jgi:acetyl esterase/lipase